MRKLHTLTFMFVSLLLSGSINAQKNQKEEVKQVVVNLFDAMRASNERGLKSCFHKGAILETVYEKEGEMRLHRMDADDFINQVVEPHAGVYNEVIKSYTIETDGKMASVWAPYEFYLDDKLLHCGVNSIQLFKHNDGWKITYVIDTRQVEGCLNE